MNKSDLRKIIREEIVKEFMGFSKQEKNIKSVENLGKKAEQEIDKYNFGRLFSGLSKTDNSNSNMKKLIEFRLKDAADYMPSLKLLIPQMFEITGATGAVDARYDLGSGLINGIIPSTFYSGLVNQYVLQPDKMKEYVKNKVQEKLKNLLSNR